MPFSPGSQRRSAASSPFAAMTRAQARLGWSAIAATLVVAVGASAALAPLNREPLAGDVVPILLAIVALVTAVDLSAAYAITASVRRRAATVAPGDASAGVQTVIACALVLGATLFAAIGHFLTRRPTFLLLVLPGAAVLVHWFPSQARWAALTPPPAAGAEASPQPRRMTRE